MMAATQKITVRKAREEDYEAVLNITDNFNMGADYIYFQYKELINDPDSSYYVCEVDGEVAAFEGVSLIDDNNTLMTRSARVKSKFQGQGLLNRIREQIHEDYNDLPGQKRIRTCCTNVVRLVTSPRFRSLNRLLATRVQFAYACTVAYEASNLITVNNVTHEPPLQELVTASCGFPNNEPTAEVAPGSIKSSITNKPKKPIFLQELTAYQPLDVLKLPATIRNATPDVQELDPDHLGILFQNKELANYLFPAGFIAVISWFFDLLVSNIRHIKKLSPYFSISDALDDSVKKLIYFSNAGHNIENILVDNGEGKGSPPQGLFSVSAYYITPDMLFFTSDIYGEPRHGKEESDVRHIIFHGLQYALSIVEQKELKLPVAFGISIKDTAILDICKNVLELLGFQQGELGDFQKHYFFEQDFEKLLSA